MKLNNKQRKYLEDRLKSVKEILRSEPKYGYISYLFEQERIELLLALDKMQENDDE